MKPQEIEQESFAIIDAEAGSHSFSPDQWTIVRRMIHTSADFDYLRSVLFSPDAVTSGVAAVRAGATVYTDTEMARSGIRGRSLERFGGRVICRMADPEIARAAQAGGITRARAAVEAVADRLDGSIYVVGNAPTALLRLIDLIQERRARPALVVGLPVGFVNAAESKAALPATAVPYITNVGRKGGSNVAAAVVNALILLAESPHAPA
jgi:precorrin-8X/cobalt-precorrin-8 methylmutase